MAPTVSQTPMNATSSFSSGSTAWFFLRRAIEASLSAATSASEGIFPLRSLALACLKAVFLKSFQLSTIVSVPRPVAVVFGIHYAAVLDEPRQSPYGVRSPAEPE